MASKGPRSKLDHESRAKRQKALEAPREPRRPKTHWDHVLEEMVWLSKDFESERKWKLAQAKKVALKASKGMLDQATRGERRLKEDEQRMRKVALNISKDVKKFWTKIEKLVLYKHQLELDDRKKKALDKQLEYLLGQTERYSTMLAENLIGSSNSCQPPQSYNQGSPNISQREGGENNVDASGELFAENKSDALEDDDDYDVESEDEHDYDVESEDDLVRLLRGSPDTQQKEGGENNVDASGESLAERKSHALEDDDDYDLESEDDLEDDEQTMEEDEALITAKERQEELAALQNEVDLPLEELLKCYSNGEANNDVSNEKVDAPDLTMKDGIDSTASGGTEHGSHAAVNCSVAENHGLVNISGDDLLAADNPQTRRSRELASDSENDHAVYDFNEEQDDEEFVFATGEEKDDETTLEEEDELAKVESVNHIDEIALLQKESEIPLEDLLAKYGKDSTLDGSLDDVSDYESANSDLQGSPADQEFELKQHPTPMVQDDLSPQAPPAYEGRVTEHGVDSGEETERDKEIANAAAAARSAQPTGSTFSTTKVRTKFPFLLKYPLREYQHIGLDWLVTMYEKRLNGILADEMGLGKTIMTIALLAHLACEKGIWGPHLIVVPTSVMLNWETEFLKWCPAFKILTYFGSAKERKHKRQGWMKLNSFHVCITTYRLVIQDSKIFKRKKWKYLILDEAHLIKNWKSQRWQTLLNFNSKRRILLTGTPLQNDLMELWSLMHFLMPHIFQSHQEFKDWFCNPISGMVEGQDKVNKEVVDRLHNVLRPFILRRLKRDVEKQLPMKQEHVIYCRLSKRQRSLYEDFIASSETQATLASSNFFGMLNVIMQLRKVCNHPDLFEGRPIISSFDMAGIDMQMSSAVCSALSRNSFSSVDISGLGLLFTYLDFSMASWESDEIQAIATPSRLIEERVDFDSSPYVTPGTQHHRHSHVTNIFDEIRKAVLEERRKEAKERAVAIAWWNSLKCQKRPMYSTSLRDLVTVKHPLNDIHLHKSNPVTYQYSSKLANIVLSPVERFERMVDQVEAFMFAIPAARAPQRSSWCSKSGAPVFVSESYKQTCSELLLPLLSPIRPAIVRRQLYFPDRRLIQFDCGKLQRLAVLLRRLKLEGHRALIFTQMTKMLDILEAFINLYGYTYMRLDGSTQPEERQTLMQRFNTNPKIFLFILSTRSGGVGVNLVGADTVIFYDSDWNPAMDQQAQDRCHRIGQTREVHIYRLISESTIEENILKKANQKRALDDLVIQSGGYNTEFFKKLDPMELFSGYKLDPVKNLQKERACGDGSEGPVSSVDLEAALKNAEDEADYMALKRVEQEEAVDNQEFTEETMGRIEDEDVVNDDDTKADEYLEQHGLLPAPDKESGDAPDDNNPDVEKAVSFACDEDDVDMLADVKQMAAAAAAAGHEVLSFENQLRPIDRYALRFLELWDPVIDKAAVQFQVEFDKKEWELEHIEKLKEDMEAENDDDEEPLVYETWDADFATQAYRQEVEALAQHQLMEELEKKAKEKEEAENAENRTMYDGSSSIKPKSKKKKKKNRQKIARLNSLKEKSQASAPKLLKDEVVLEPIFSDNEDDICHEMAATADMGVPRAASQKKRKKAEINQDAEEDKTTRTKSKKRKKVTVAHCLPNMDSNSCGKIHKESKDTRGYEDGVVDLELKPASRAKMGGKISITAVPMKKFIMLKPEKIRKKGNMWTDGFPTPDSWLPQEDAVLCALVHEYGPNWGLVSETLYGMPAGGRYRGRFRHSVHCCERFRELVQKYVLSVADNVNSEKTCSSVPAKALLKVSEDNVQVLLDVAMELPDRELLVQKHFTALLSSAWRVKSAVDRQHNLTASENCHHSGLRLFGKSVKPSAQMADVGSSPGATTTKFSHCRRLLAMALHVADKKQCDDIDSSFNQKEDTPRPAASEDFDLSLEIGVDSPDFPSFVTLSLPSLEQPSTVKISSKENVLRTFHHMADSRFRAASTACSEGGIGWALSAFPVNEPKPRAVFKSPVLGKHKLSGGETSKSSKSKTRKVSVEHSVEAPERTSNLEPDHQLLPTVSCGEAKSTPDSLTSVCLDDFTSNFVSETFCSLDEELPFGAISPNLVPHRYTPELISDLDDCSVLPEYTDIG